MTAAENDRRRLIGFRKALGRRHVARPRALSVRKSHAVRRSVQLTPAVRSKVAWGDTHFDAALRHGWVQWEWWGVVVTKLAGQVGFVVQPKRWIVERTFGWLGRSRRLSKEYERTVASSEAFVKVAMIPPHGPPAPEVRLPLFGQALRVTAGWAAGGSSAGTAAAARSRPRASAAVAERDMSRVLSSE